MYTIANTIAGIGWEPEIRGALTIVLGVTVLMGSVWLLLATNTGIRLGTLIALAGFFGWMFLMGILWWIYGIGWVGTTPTWVFEELASESEGSAEIRVDDVEQIVDNNRQARAIDLVRELGSDSLQAELDMVDVAGITSLLTDANEALPDDDPRKEDDASLANSIDKALDDAGRRIEQLTLTQLASLAPEVIEEANAAGQINFGNWRLVDAAEAGEAQTATTAALAEEGTFGASDSFVFLNAYQRGGKDRRADNSIWNRFTNRIDRLVTLQHPTNYTVVQVQKAIAKDTPLGGVTPFAEIDADEPVLNVVLVRDLGNRRLKPALVTVVSFLLFLATVFTLHLRDRNFDKTETAHANAGA